jgi:SAM-dependent methyltransferase
MGEAYFKEWKGCFEEFVRRRKIKYGSVVDVACGTGNALLYFFNKNIRVVGIERSPEMLREAGHKIGKRKIRLFNMDMRSFDLDEPADLITCNFNALNDLATQRDVKRTFRSFYDNLNNKGWVVFDVITVENGRDIFGEGSELIVSKEKDCYVTLSEKWNEAEKSKYLYFHFFIRKKKGLFRLYETSHKLKAYFIEDLCLYLKDAGFKKMFYCPWEDFSSLKLEFCGRYLFAAQK